jgi:golgi SNAP receptor complex member 2
MARRCQPLVRWTTTTMNSLYTLGVRQSSSIQADLERLRGGDTSASLQGLSHSHTMHALLKTADLA